MISEQETYGQAEEQKPRGLGMVVSRVRPVVRLLPYLLAALIIIVPLVFATAWPSFVVHYDKIRTAFETGRTVDGVAGLLQILLLIIPLVGVTLAFALVVRRLGALVWRWSEGRPVLRTALSSARFGLTIVAVAALGVGLFTWLPNAGRPTTGSLTLTEALQNAGSRVASVLLPSSDAASAEEADSDSSVPKQLLDIITRPILPQDGEERDNASATSSSEKSKGSENPNNKDSSPSQPTEDAASPNPVTLAPKGPVPTVTEAPPMSTEEPATVAPTAPAASPAPETAPAPEPVIPKPAPEPAPTPEVSPAPEPVTPKPAPEPTASEPKGSGVTFTPDPKVTPKPTAPGQTPAPEPVTLQPQGQSDPSVPSLHCTTSPGDAPGSTTTYCSNAPAS